MLGAMASSKVTDPRPSDDQPKKRSKSAERVALETGVGELKLNVADGEEDLKELEANQEGLESAFDDCLGSLLAVGIGMKPVSLPVRSDVALPGNYKLNIRKEGR